MSNIVTLPIRRVAGVCILLLVWAAMFMVGCQVSSAWYQARAYEMSGSLWSLPYYLFSFVTWGWANIMLMILLASVAGYLAGDQQIDGGDWDTRILRVLVRGFFIFLVMVSGQFLVSGSVEGATALLQQSQYFRYGTIGSLFSFIIGYDPQLMKSILERIMKAMMGVNGTEFEEKLGETGGLQGSTLTTSPKTPDPVNGGGNGVAATVGAVASTTDPMINPATRKPFDQGHAEAPVT